MFASKSGHANGSEHRRGRLASLSLAFAAFAEVDSTGVSCGPRLTPRGPFPAARPAGLSGGQKGRTKLSCGQTARAKQPPSLILEHSRALWTIVEPVESQWRVASGEWPEQSGERKRRHCHWRVPETWAGGQLAAKQTGGQSCGLRVQWFPVVNCAGRFAADDEPLRVRGPLQGCLCGGTQTGRPQLSARNRIRISNWPPTGRPSASVGEAEERSSEQANHWKTIGREKPRPAHLRSSFQASKWPEGGQKPEVGEQDGNGATSWEGEWPATKERRKASWAGTKSNTMATKFGPISTADDAKQEVSVGRQVQTVHPS